MIPSSIRWRLPFSYAAIALLTALSLGAVLLTALRSYYAERENEYLQGSARVISHLVAETFQAELPPESLKAPLKSFSFLSQTRVQILNLEGQVLIDSGNPENHDVISISFMGKPADRVGMMYPPGQILEGWSATAVRSTIPVGMVSGMSGQAFEEVRVPTNPYFVIDQTVSGSPAGDEMFIQRMESRPVLPCSPPGDSSIPGENCILRALTERNPYLPDVSLGGERWVAEIPTAATLYGYGLNPGSRPYDGARSDQLVKAIISDNEGSVLGYVQISHGPAYGREIIEGVARGWAVACAVSVLLAGSAGWLMSRRMSAPLLALSDVTTRMAHGDLSARANVARQDEFGTLAQSFNEMAVRVEDTVVMLRRFVADAAHELHTPLTALHTNLELAATEERENNRIRFIQSAQEQLQRLEGLTSGLLDLSRIETNGAKQERIPVNLTALVAETSESYASWAEQAGLGFRFDLPSEPIIIPVNDAQLRRALCNLLDNAIKFTPEGGEVSIGLRRNDTYVELWVQDTGIGISMEDLPYVFNRFHRGHNATAYPGSGLGLAIIKAIVDHHSGELTVESRPGNTRVALQLPNLS